MDEKPENIPTFGADIETGQPLILGVGIRWCPFQWVGPADNPLRKGIPMSSASMRLRFAHCCLVTLALISTNCAQARGRSEEVVYAFQGGDGFDPVSRLSKDKFGNLYGTTFFGGGEYNNGVVFEVTPQGNEKTLYSFGLCNGGCYPFGGLIGGRFHYGTTDDGGVNCDSGGCGTVYQVSADGTETTLYEFQGGSDGAHPAGDLVRDSSGSFYGTTQQGGGTGCSGDGCGTVFKLSPKGTETVMHSFGGGSDGALPLAGLIMDAAGNLYGTTDYGGGSTACDPGCGTVFKITPDGTESVIHSFNNNDGAYPVAGLTTDSDGNLYSTTNGGGAYGAGAIFKVTPDGAETTIYSFTGGSDGGYPIGNLTRTNSRGVFYGTAGSGAKGQGTVFKFTADGTLTVLHAFTGGSDGAGPQAGLIWDGGGMLYGTTAEGGGTGCGGRGCGTVFRVEK